MLLWGALALGSEAPDTPPVDPMPPRLWDFTHLDLDVQLDVDGRSITGTATHTLEALDGPHDRVRLHQRALDIRAVRVDDQQTTFTVGEGWLDVDLPLGVSHTVAIDYATRPAMGLYFRSPDWGDPIVEVFTQGQDEDNRWWFPGWDHPSDRFTVTTHVTAPQRLVVRALGDQVAHEVHDGRARWTFALDRPVVNHLVTLVAGEYQVVHLDGTVPIEVLAAHTVPRAVVERTVADLPDMLPFFAELLDEPYPYSRLRLVYVQRFPYGGMENPTLTLMNDRLLVTHDDTHARRRSAEMSAHEVAHHWFGDLISCHGWNAWWLNEGFAKYYEKRFIGHRYGEQALAVDLLATSDRARELPRALEPTALTREPDTPVETWSGVYPKGATVLHGLREDLTPVVFDQGIADYVDAHRDGFVEGADLRRRLEERSGTPLGRTFDQFVSGRGIPAYTVDTAFDDGEWVLTVATSTERATASVLVEIGTANGVLTRTLQLDGPTTRLRVPLEAPPDWVVLDPDRTRLATFAHVQSPTSWLAALTRSDRPTVRLLAMEALGTGPADATALRVLHAIARSDAEVSYRAAAVRALGQHAARPSVAVWLRRFVQTDAEGLIRRTAVESLANTPAHIECLTLTAADDPLPSVRVAALHRLAEHAPEHAVAVARARLRDADPTAHGRLHAAALGILAEHGRAGDHSRLADALDDPRHLTRQAAFRAVGARLQQLDEGRARRRLQDALAKAVAHRLDDPELLARSLALELARHLRPEHADLLERFRASNPVPSLDRQATKALRHLRQPDGADERPDHLQSPHGRRAR